MFRKLFVYTLILLYLPGTISARDSKPIHAYENSDIGVKAEFNTNWSIYTDRKNAAEMFKNFFPKKKKKNESPLFYGFSQNQQLGSRLMFEKFDGSVIEYFDIIYGKSPQVKTISAKYSTKEETVEWVYGTKQGMLSFVYKEFFTKVRRDIIRFTFWTLEPIYPKYEKEFNTILGYVSFLSSENKWTRPWVNIQGSLVSDSLSYVKIAAPDKKEEVDECEGSGKDVFWEVKGEKNTVYLFGSIHLGKPDFYPFNEKIESAFKNSKYIGIEVNQNTDTFKQEMALVVKNSMLTGKKTINNFLSDAVYKKLEENVQKIGLPIDNFLKFPPWLLSVTLAVLKMQAMGYHPDYGVEKYFLDKIGPDKTIVEFEHLDEQVALFESLNNENFLAYTLFSLNTMDVDTKKLVNAWKCGKLDVLEEMLLNDYKKVIPNRDEINDRLFYKRNKKMAEKIKECLKEDQDYFVILGAGHFVGEKGIVSILTKDGYRVTR